MLFRSGGRVPSPAEVTLCLPFLHRLIALTAPRRIVLFSTQGARVLLPAATGRRRPSATWVETTFPGAHLPIPVLSLPGLDAIQKTANARRDAWAGLRQLRRALDADT